MERQALHEQGRDESDSGDADHYLPDHLETVCERLANDRLQGLFEGSDDGDDGICEGNSLGELLYKFLRQAAGELSLQDRNSDGERPDLLREMSKHSQDWP